MKTEAEPVRIRRYADMFSALGMEARLRILRTLLSAHPEGLVVGELQEALGIPASTLSHHLEKLRHEGLVTMRREQRFLRYAADTGMLQELVGFLFQECCSRTGEVPSSILVQIRKSTRPSRKE